MNLPLFDRPVQTSAQFKRDDVRRVIEAKTGPFLEVVGGQPTGREYRILELLSGTLVAEFTDDGARVMPAPTCTDTLLRDGLHFGTMREVRS